MRSPVLGLALMALLIVAGFGAALALGRSREERFAALYSFLVLVIDFAAFSLAVVEASLVHLAPVFAFAAIVLPTITYPVAIRLLLRKRRKEEIARKSESIRLASASLTEVAEDLAKGAVDLATVVPELPELPDLPASAVEESQESRVETKFGSEAESEAESELVADLASRLELEPVRLEIPVIESDFDIKLDIVSEKDSEAFVESFDLALPVDFVEPLDPFRVEEASEAAAFGLRVDLLPVEPEAASGFVLEPEPEPALIPASSSGQEPVVEFLPEQALEPEAAFDLASEPTSKSEPAPEPGLTLALELDSAPAPDSTSAPEPEPDPTPEPDPAPAPVSVAQSYYDKAQGLREAGNYAISARLFMECHRRAEASAAAVDAAVQSGEPLDGVAIDTAFSDTVLARKAALAAMGCYAKAGNGEAAYELALKIDRFRLKLSRSDKMKLDVVLKMSNRENHQGTG